MSSDATAVARVLRRAGASEWLIVCEHASHQMPEAVNSLGLDDEARLSHVAWDPGAAEVATRLSELLDATAVLHNFSRLLYDCNRPPSADSAVPLVSERTAIPGNQALSPADRQTRVDTWYTPFHDEIDVLFNERAQRQQKTLLVTVHSFTRVYFDKPRRVELGIITDTDERLGLALFKALDETPWQIEMNQPYSSADGVTHMLQRHGIARNIANVMLEIRNDLLTTDDTQQRWATTLANALSKARARLNPDYSPDGE